VKKVLTKLHGGPSGDDLGVSKTLNKFQQWYYWLQARSDTEKWCQQCDTCAASHDPRTRNKGKMHQYSVWAPFKRIAVDVAGPFLLSYQGYRYLLIAMDYFTKWPEAYALPKQVVSTVAEALITNLFCCFGIPRKLHGDQAVTSNIVSYRKFYSASE
jgi:hypothetical protein